MSCEVEAQVKAHEEYPLVSTADMRRAQSNVFAVTIGYVALGALFFCWLSATLYSYPLFPLQTDDLGELMI